jgi:hypothetical protein
MSAKQVKFSVDARDRMLHGIDTLAHAVRSVPKAAMSCSTSPTALRASQKTV